jgi:hypothetical protein
MQADAIVTSRGTHGGTLFRIEPHGRRITFALRIEQNPAYWYRLR